MNPITGEFWAVTPKIYDFLEFLEFPRVFDVFFEFFLDFFWIFWKCAMFFRNSKEIPKKHSVFIVFYRFRDFRPGPRGPPRRSPEIVQNDRFRYGFLIGCGLEAGWLNFQAPRPGRKIYAKTTKTRCFFGILLEFQAKTPYF